jgi:serine/threonine protein kinase
MSTNWQPGDRINGRWEIEQVLAGGMGIVYVVRDNETEERLAAKTYRDDVLAANPELPFRFEREAVAWVNLDSHPNIVKARFVQIIQGKPFLFLEYISGGNLRALLPSLKVSPNFADVDSDSYNGYYLRLSTIQHLAINFCDGMIHASKCGITAHRDIKAENCLVTEESWRPTLKITDYGLAKVFDDAGIPGDAPYIVRVPLEGLSSGGTQSYETVDQVPLPEGVSVFVTRTGVAAGTPSHMAPEQFDDVKRVDVRADVYSFGIMLFQMITGSLPFAGRTWLDYRRLHQTVIPPKLTTIYTELNDIVARCLAKNPRERFGDFGELRGELESSVYDRYETYLNFIERSVAIKLTEDELLEKAVSLVHLRRYQQALTVVNQVLKRHPMNRGAWIEKGLLLMNGFHRFDEALTCFKHAQRLGEHRSEEYIVLCQNKLAEPGATAGRLAKEEVKRVAELWGSPRAQGRCDNPRRTSRSSRPAT